MDLSKITMPTTNQKLLFILDRLRDLKEELETNDLEVRVDLGVLTFMLWEMTDEE